MNSMNSAILDPRLSWITLAALSALWIWLGWLWGRNTKDLDEYALAGRRVGLALGTATSMATWVTSNTTMAAPQLTLQVGIWGMLGYFPRDGRSAYACPAYQADPSTYA
jgi:Na+/proline symporter